MLKQFSQQVKVVGGNGQLSLGKAFAGKMVLVDQIDDGTWLIKSGIFIPDSEKWLYRDQNLEMLDRAIEWTEKNKPRDNFEEIAKSVEHGEKSKY